MESGHRSATAALHWPRNVSSLRTISGHAGTLLLPVLTVIVARRAWAKGLAGEPEWCYWSLAAEDGPLWQDANLGYLPVFSLLLRPFFAIGGSVGLPLFVALALGCSWAAFHLMWKQTAIELRTGTEVYGPLHLLWFSGPFLVSVRNNQVAVQMMLLLALGMYLLSRDRERLGAVLIGTSVMIKPLPLTLGMCLLLQRRWRPALLLALVALAGSFLLTSLDVGVADSLRRHLDWPPRVLGLEPTSGSSYFGGNQSVAASIVRLEPWLGSSATFALRWGLFGLSLLGVCWAVVRRRHRRGSQWEDMALWLAWTAFAAPFGRYYYSILLVPAWLILFYGQRESERGFTLGRASAGFLPLLAWGGPTMGAFAVSTAVTFALMLHRALRTSRDVMAPSGLSERPRPEPERAPVALPT